MATRQVPAGTIEGNPSIERSSTNTSSRTFTMNQANAVSKPSHPLAKTNFLKVILAPQRTHDEVKRIYCMLINAMTGSVCSNVMRALSDEKYGRDMDAVSSLDDRNEKDEHARGEEVSDYMTHATGHAYPVKPMQVARVLDSIRYTLYEDMHGFGEYASEVDALTFAPKVDPSALRNYTQPMSAQLYMNFRISMADRVDESRVAVARTMIPDAPEAMIREALTKEALKQRATLIEMKPAVLYEIDSMQETFDLDAFTGIGIEAQCALATKIATKLDEQYMRTLPRAIRSLEALSELNMIKAEHSLVSSWLRDNDAELQDAIVYRDSLRNNTAAGVAATTADNGDDRAIVDAMRAARATRDAAPAASM